jgi:RNAse (barnase) inhibitor barstar
VVKYIKIVRGSKMSLKDLDCDKVTKLEDIQNEGKYVDPSGKNNPTDRKFVSCLQTHYKDKFGIEEEYNELEYIIDTHFKEYKGDEFLYKVLCECCKEKEEYKKSADSFRDLLTTQRDRFVECVQKRINRFRTDKLLGI